MGFGGMGVAVGAGVSVGDGVSVGGIVPKMVGWMTMVGSGVAGAGDEQAVMTSVSVDNTVPSQIRLNDCMMIDGLVYSLRRRENDKSLPILGGF